MGLLKNALKQYSSDPVQTGGESVSYTSNIQPYAAKALQSLYADLLSHGSNLPEGMSLKEFQELQKTNPTKAKELQAEVAKNKAYGKPRLATYTPLQEKIFGKMDKNTGEYNPAGSMLESELGNQSYGNQFNQGTQKIGELLNKEVSPNIQGYLSNATRNPLGAETEEQYIANRHPGIMKMYEDQSNRNLRENVLPAIGDQFISSRMYGGGRHADIADRAQRGNEEMLQNRREAIANQLSQQFHGAQANYGQRNLGAANIAENAGGQDINRQATLAGRLQESALANRQGNQQALQFGANMAQLPQYQHQQALNVAHQDWEKQQNAPLEHIGRASNFLNQMPMSSQTTTVTPPQITPQASPWTQGAGLLGAVGTSMMGSSAPRAAHGGHITQALAQRKHYAQGGQVSPQGTGAVQQTFYVGDPNSNNTGNQGYAPQQPQGINGGMQNTMMRAQPQGSFSAMQSMLTQPSGGMPNNPNWYQEFANQQYNQPQQQDQGMAPQQNMGQQPPQMMAHGGHIRNIRHYAQGGGVPQSPIHRGVNDALDSTELNQIREDAMRMRQSQGDPLWGALTKGFLNIAANRKPGVLAAIGEGGQAAFDEYGNQQKALHERSLESSKLLKMIDDTRRWQAEQNRTHEHKTNELALDRDYKMGTLGESQRHHGVMEEIKRDEAEKTIATNVPKHVIKEYEKYQNAKNEAQLLIQAQALLEKGKPLYDKGKMLTEALPDKFKNDDQAAFEELQSSLKGLKFKRFGYRNQAEFKSIKEIDPYLSQAANKKIIEQQLKQLEPILKKGQSLTQKYPSLNNEEDEEEMDGGAPIEQENDQATNSSNKSRLEQLLAEKARRGLA